MAEKKTKKKTSNDITQISEEERIKSIKLLKASYEMYERTKRETRERRSNAVDKTGNKIYTEESLNDVLQLLDTMQKEAYDKYIALGGDPEDLKKLETKKTTRSNKKLFDRKELLKSIIESEKKEESIPSIPIMEEPDMKEEVPAFTEIIDNVEEDVIDKVTVDPSKYIGNKVKYDLVKLPSKGEPYKSKQSKVPVGLLTAYDENLIISPNLYEDGNFLDYILKEKLMNDEIDPDDMIEGDRDAIILWLRASSYGTDFPITATDPITGEKFDTTIDLTDINYKKFNLKADKNGYFTFELPVSKDTIKFKFLSHKDTKELTKMQESESKVERKTKIRDLYYDLKKLIDEEDDIDKVLKANINTANKAYEKYIDTLPDSDDGFITHMVTNRLLKSIVSINGVNDRKYIEEYVSFMNVKDSSSLRKYIKENEPGIDFSITINRPESLGGGSFDTFLSFDQFIFLRIPE